MPGAESRPARRTTVATVAAIGVLSFFGAGASAQTPSGDEPGARVADGVFTETQARQGEKVMRNVCSSCHMPDYYKGTFLQAWRGTTLDRLYNLISTTMPEDRPGGLKRREYTAVLAYILELNGLPPGDEELTGLQTDLQEILIEWRD